MKCPFCEKLNKKSKVYPHGGSKTLLGHSPFYDEEGTYHSHDPNKVTQTYSCSEDHEWLTRGRSKCPNCDYGGITEIEDLTEYQENA